MIKIGSNPVMKEETFTGLPHLAASSTMTVGGAMMKTGILLVLAMCTAGYSYGLAIKEVSSPLVIPMMFGGVIVALILSLVTCFNPSWSPITGPLYALTKGLVVGIVSTFYAMQFEGIIAQAVMLTFGLALLMAALYVMRIIKPTQKFKMVVISATGGIFLVYILTWILGFFGIQIPFIHDNGLFGIGFSLFVVVIASLNLIIDFEMVERGAEQGAPKYMEWYAGFAILVTLVWLYFEILRLLAKLRSRD